MEEKHNVNMIQHNLRSRDTIRYAASRYASQDQLQNHAIVNKIKTLKRKCPGKKDLITKKSNQIKRLIEKGSQTKRKFFHETLMHSKREAAEIHK